MPKTTNPRQTELHLYRLEPVPALRERDEWEASILKEACFVWAASAREARAMVEVETRAPIGDQDQASFLLSLVEQHLHVMRGSDAGGRCRALSRRNGLH
jgi:hypothetical protein